MICIITARIRSMTGRYCFHRCLSVNISGGGGPDQAFSLGRGGEGPDPAFNLGQGGGAQSSLGHGGVSQSSLGQGGQGTRSQ